MGTVRSSSRQLYYLLCRVLIITANWSEQTLHIDYGCNHQTDILETIPEWRLRLDLLSSIPLSTVASAMAIIYREEFSPGTCN